MAPVGRTRSGKAKPPTAAPKNTNAITRNAIQATVQSTHPTPATHTKTVQQTTASNDQFVTAKQSLELAQSFVYGVTSTILSIRDILPPEDFQTTYYAAVDKHCSYEDFTSVAAKYIPKPGERRPTGGVINTLKRGSSKLGDDIIQVLESCIFPILKAGYLDKMEMSFLENPEERSNILELYSFSFRYTQSETYTDEEQQRIDIDVEDPHGKHKVTLANAREALGTVIRGMVHLNGVLPFLPPRRYMLFHVRVNDRCPKGHLTPGFIPRAAASSVRFPTGDWEMRSSNCGQMDTGFRSVGLRVSYTSRVGPTNSQEDEAIPNDELTYGKAVDRLDIAEDQVVQVDIPPSSLHHKLQTQEPLVTDRRAKEVAVSTPTTTPGLEDPEEQDQYSQVRDRNALVFMQGLQHDLPTTSGHDTQQFSSRDDSFQQLEFSRETIRQLDKVRSRQLGPRKASLGRDASSSTPVRCQCGQHHHEENSMLYCGFCETLQHHTCYGYVEANVVTVPDYHVCYECLFAGKPAQLEPFLYLARLRRIVQALRKKSFSKEPELAAAVGYRTGDVMAPLKTLKSKGYLMTSKEARNIPGGKNIVLTTAPERQKALMAEYFDPTLSIEEYLSHPSAPELPVSLPPFTGPATPSSKRPNPEEVQVPSPKRARKQEHAMLTRPSVTQTPKWREGDRLFTCNELHTPSHERYV